MLLLLTLSLFIISLLSVFDWEMLLYNFFIVGIYWLRGVMGNIDFSSLLGFD